MKLTYHYENGYWIPNLSTPPAPKIGIWGYRRLDFLRKHKSPIYQAMLMDDALNAHLEEVDHQAHEMLDLLIRQMAEHEGITEQLKAADQMAWVGAMNNIRARVEEIVYRELICS